MGTTYHVHASISGLLTKTDKQLGKLFNKEGREARKELAERYKKGELYLGSENCEGFDPRKGCPGHRHDDVEGGCPVNEIDNVEKPVIEKKYQIDDWSNYLPVMSNIHDRTGISIEWQKLWSEIENWYGDPKKRESGEQFLKRMQATYFADPYIHTRKESAEEEWEAFWKGIVTNEDGTINLEQVKKELADFSFVMEQVPKVYCHITGSKMSKVMYHADTVISVSDDYFNEQLGEAVKAEVGKPGAVWVKANERLPNSWHLKCARFIHTKTFLLDPENWLKENERAMQDVEWLDEGTTAAPIYGANEYPDLSSAMILFCFRFPFYTIDTQIGRVGVCGVMVNIVIEFRIVAFPYFPCFQILRLMLHSVTIFYLLPELAGFAGLKLRICPASTN